MTTKSKLIISPQPFKPSYLSIPPSPCTPRTPLFFTNPFLQSIRTANYVPDGETPPKPMQWMWTCHQCRRIYSLGVTRRCLEDGHYFCAGATTLKTWRKPLRTGKVRKHRACASEFDYKGWKAWGRWRRAGRRDSIIDGTRPPSPKSEVRDSGRKPGHITTLGSKKPKDCWTSCDYPSECRWGRKFGIHTPLTSAFPSPTLELPPPPSPYTPSPTATQPALTTFEGILKPENCKEARKEEKEENTDFWGALEGATRRKSSVHSSSPLAELGRVESAAEIDADGDVVMSMSVEVVPGSPKAASAVTLLGRPSSVSTKVTLKGLFKKSSKRVAAFASKWEKDKVAGGPISISLPEDGARGEMLNVLPEDGKMK